MLSSTEFKILPDETAKIIADNEKKDKKRSKQSSVISEHKALLFEQTSVISKYTSTIHKQASVISKLEKRLIYYENHNSPPSQNSIPSQGRKERVRVSNTGNTSKKSGHKSGHKGQSHNQKRP